MIVIPSLIWTLPNPNPWKILFLYQYAYARICSIIEKAVPNIVLNDQNKDGIDLALLDKKEELEIIRN